MKASCADVARVHKNLKRVAIAIPHCFKSIIKHPGPRSWSFPHSPNLHDNWGGILHASMHTVPGQLISQNTLPLPACWWSLHYFSSACVEENCHHPANENLLKTSHLVVDACGLYHKRFGCCIQWLVTWLRLQSSAICRKPLWPVGRHPRGTKEHQLAQTSYAFACEEATCCDVMGAKWHGSPLNLYQPFEIPELQTSI